MIAHVGLYNGHDPTSIYVTHKRRTGAISKFSVRNGGDTVVLVVHSLLALQELFCIVTKS